MTGEEIVGGRDMSPRGTTPPLHPQEVSPPPTYRPPTCEDVEDDRDNPMGQPSHGPGVFLDDGPTLHTDNEVTPEDIRAELAELLEAQAFIECIRGAKLDLDAIDKDVLERLRNPPTGPLDITERNTALSLKIYLGMDNIPIEQYSFLQKALVEHNIHLLSFEQVKALAAEYSGVKPIYEDMCPRSCVGFTGPFRDMRSCPICGEDRYEMRTRTLSSRSKHEVSRRRFLTLPVGPSLQAMYRSPEGADAMGYRNRVTSQISQEIDESGLGILIMKDLLYGSEYNEAVRRGDITDNDIVLLLSVDGAQLYAMKQSSCWIYIWIVMELAPDMRYKKKNIIIGGIIPGPEQPKNLDSFIYTGLYHVAALMKEGLVVWDAHKDEIITKNPYIALLTADGPGMVDLDGSVGHKGAQGCRLHCAQPGRLKPGSTHYYPACQLPHGYEIPGSDHEDVQLRMPPDPNAPSSSERYQANLRELLQARTDTAYKRLRRKTGLVKPSIFSGIPPDRIFPLPGCFPGDIMHLLCINIPELLFKLWRGLLECDKDDDRSLWEWATLKGDTWKRHGQAVADTREYLPGSFDRPPRNPAEKISSGYKAAEFLNYLYVMGPALFKDVLPEQYWLNFCKLVRGVRLLHQRVISTEEISQAHNLLIEFCEEFENIYCQRMPTRLHFVRQSIHALIHIAPETIRLGPYVIFSQWTMERIIGQLVRDIRNPGLPYENLIQVAVRRTQRDAIRNISPELDRMSLKNTSPRGSIDLGDGYILLRAADRSPRGVTEQEAKALTDFAHQNPQYGANAQWFRCPKVIRWARVALPTLQIARSTWSETDRRRTPRKSSNIKVSFSFKASHSRYSHIMLP